MKEKGLANILIREAKVENAHMIAEAERDIAKEPGLLFLLTAF